MASKYHDIEKDGLPKENGTYMVKVYMPQYNVWDNIELCFRQFKDGKFDRPYYANPETDELIGWYENEKESLQ